MEHGSRIVEGDPNTTSGFFADLGSGSAQQRFDLAPAKVCRGRFGKDPAQRSAVAAVHRIMISQMDIFGHPARHADTGTVRL
jgi:hypothetical protein